MSGELPTLEQQAQAVERAAVNQRGHCSNLGELVKRGKRPEAEWREFLRWTPHLEAAAKTLRTLADQQKATP